MPIPEDLTSPVVVVVDDDPDVLKALSRLIRFAGHRVEALPDPRALLDHVTPDRPGCIILDLRMPGVDGLQLQEALGHAGCTMPIVFLSGESDVLQTVRAMKAGAIDFLTKPVDDEQLLAAIGTALARDAADRAARAERADLRARLARLTPRELEVCHLVGAGLLNKQIAGELGTSEKTVKVHRGRVMAKLQVNSVAELVRLIDAADQPAGH